MASELYPCGSCRRTMRVHPNEDRAVFCEQCAARIKAKAERKAKPARTRKPEPDVLEGITKWSTSSSQ